MARNSAARHPAVNPLVCEIEFTHGAWWRLLSQGPGESRACTTAVDGRTSPVGVGVWGWVGAFDVCSDTGAVAWCHVHMAACMCACVYTSVCACVCMCAEGAHIRVRMCVRVC